MKVKKKSFSSIAGYCFIAILFGVFILNAIIPDAKKSVSENRMLQGFPKFSVSEYMEGRFESKMERYANDQFMMRKELVKVKTSVDSTIGKLENNGVYKGRDGYLIEDIAVPEKAQLKETEDALKSFKSDYPKVKMYFLLAPNAGNIMSDKLPATTHLANQNKYMDEFFDSVKRSGYTAIDVRKAFLKAKGDTQLYYRTDHHWTSDGAYLAYKNASPLMGIARPLKYKQIVVKNDFNGTLYSKSGFTNGRSDAIKVSIPASQNGFLNSVVYYSDSKTKTTKLYETKNLKKKDAYTVFGGSNHPMYTIKTPVKANKRLLVVKDSYANSFVPMLTQNYREIVVVDPRYYFDNINDLMATEGITEVLFLYNGNTFFQDNSLEMMLNN